MQRFLLALCLLLLGSAVAQNQTAASSNSSAAAQNQTTTTTTNSSSTALIVANLFNNSLCQDGTVDLRTYVDGQCNQIGSQSVWMTCNQTDPSNPFILWQAFSDQAACMSALSNGAAALALNASTTYGDYCSPIGNDTALNIIACTDAAHVANITTVPAFATLSPTDPKLTYTVYGWNVSNCQGPPTIQEVTRFVAECTLYPEYWGPSAGFCVPGALIWPSYSDSECTQLNTSAPFTLEPTGICFSAGDFSYMYGPCQPTFNYTGFSSLPPAQNLTALLAQLTPTNGSLSVAPTNSSQTFDVQVFQDTQCTTKVASANGLQTVELGNCTVNPNVNLDVVGADHSFEFFCTDVGVLAVSFNSQNCSGHHRSSELYRFGECRTSDLLGFPLAVSQCTASQIPASI